MDYDVNDSMLVDTKDHTPEYWNNSFYLGVLIMLSSTIGFLWIRQTVLYAATPLTVLTT